MFVLEDRNIIKSKGIKIVFLVIGECTNFDFIYYQKNLSTVFREFREVFWAMKPQCKFANV